MTQEELAALIEKDIKQKGGAHVPIGIIQEVFNINAHVFTTLEEFAANYGWGIRHDVLPTSRVIFYPANSQRRREVKK